MQDIEFYINDEQIELSNDEKIYLSSKVNEIAVPENIKSSITQTLKVYKTKNNLEKFDYLGIANANSQIPYTDFSARLVENGITIFKKGILADIKNRNGFWSIVLKEGNANFFSLIAAFSIQDLDLSDYEDLWTQAVQISDNTNTEGQIYPIIDYGLTATHPDYMDNRELFPSVFEKTIWDAIFDPDKNPAISENWNYSGDIFSSNDFLSKIIPTLTNNLDEITNSELNSSADNLASYTEIAPSSPGGFTPVLDNIISDPNNNFSVFDVDSLKYRFPLDGAYTITLDIDFDILEGDFTEGYSTSLFFIAILSNLVPTPDEFIRRFFNLQVGNHQLSLEYNVNAVKGDDIFISIDYDTTATGIDPFIRVNTNTLSVVSVNDKKVQYDLTNPVKFPLAVNLPDINQKDFIKQTMLRYSLISSTDIVSNTVRFASFEDIKKNKNNGIVNDFTDKLDFNGVIDFDSSNFESEYELSGLSKRNKIVYTDDETVTNDFGNSFFDLESEKYKDEKDFIKFKYAATERVFRLTSNIFMPEIRILGYKDNLNAPELNFVDNISVASDFPAPLAVSINDWYKILADVTDNDTGSTNTGLSFKEDEEIVWNGNTWIKIEVQRNDKIKPRILTLNRQDIEISYYDGTATLDETENIPLCNFDDLQGNILIENYYQAYINAVSKPVVQSARYLLNIDDFVDFDHFILIYDANFNAFFYVEEITRFNPENSSRFKMLKIE